MPRIVKLIVSVFTFFITFLFANSSVGATGEFETDYKVNYIVNNKGATNVTQNITLKNKTSNYFADKFELKIGSTKVNDVKAEDETGPLTTEVKFENNITTIIVKFNQKVIGINKTLPWKLTYTSNELTYKAGQIWEVSIPRLAKTEDIGVYEATITTPTNFGDLAFVVPKAISSNFSGATQQFTFNKDQLTQSGIAMSFGEKQTFQFGLDYHLENKNLTSNVEEITLPPDNNYQKVYLEKIDPTPTNIEIDRDGNFVAKYKLPARSTLEVKASGYVEVFSRPFRNIYKPLTNDDKILYTQPQSYWEVDNAQVKEKAAELKTAKAIYDYVSSYLSYNTDRVNQLKIDRKGAASAFATPADSVCMEFTDLFIAIARAAGIPAREVEGYAYSQNTRLRPLSLAIDSKDVLHAWPEYWDNELGWVQIDPTWGSTSGGLDYFNKLDFNHITFVSRGVSSVIPFPAGAYKTAKEKDRKDVYVEFAEELPQTDLNPELIIDAPEKIISGIPTKIRAVVKNSGNTAAIASTFSLVSANFPDAVKSKEGNLEITVLPPFSTRTFEFTYQSKNLLASRDDVLVMSFADTQNSMQIKIVPFYLLFISKAFIISITIAAIIITLGLFLYKKLPKRHKNKPSII